MNIRSIVLVATITAAADLHAQSTPQAAPAKPAQAAASYKKELPAKLVAKAKVTEAAAAATALAKVPGGKITGVELEEEGGKLIYSYDITVAGKSGTDEVHVDAISGKVTGVEHEDAASEKKEADDEKSAKKAKAAPVKKP